MTIKKQCFVVQGFGKKTDYTNGRVLDLDASYEVIKEAVEQSGMECVRADEIIHTGTIDVPMYERLLNADVVIADLSTYNVNAAFELGVRYALKPYTTIVLAEEQFKNPFDLGHVVIRRYNHLGADGLSYKEAKRLIGELKKTIQVIQNQPKTDSPVYTFLPQLQPPEWLSAAKIKQMSDDSAEEMSITETAPNPAAEILGVAVPSAKDILDAAIQKIQDGDFEAGRVLLEEIRKLRPEDSFVLQQLALATYKSKQPDAVAALMAAKQILQPLTPETSNNPETLGMWGAIHKRLWEECGDPKCLSESIAAYQRGFYLKQDHYNGINLAYLLNLRALQSLQQGQADEAVADSVQAKRVRLDVIEYIRPLLSTQLEPHTRYWLISTLQEAAVGLGDTQSAQDWEAKAKALTVPNWMHDTRENQVTKLRGLLAKYLVFKANRVQTCDQSASFHRVFVQKGFKVNGVGSVMTSPGLRLAISTNC